MTEVRVAIIGAGFSSIGMACGLLRAGIGDFVILERAREVGGTWRDNVHPGAARDIPADLHSFSFAPNPNWSHRYPRQEELLAYLNDVADRFGVTPHISFGTRLAERWTPHMAALRGTTVAGFPNLFLLIGPNTALGHTSMVERAYVEPLHRALARSVRQRGGCTSYCQSADGVNPTIWPHTALAFGRTVARLHPQEFRWA